MKFRSHTLFADGTVVLYVSQESLTSLSFTHSCCHSCQSLKSLIDKGFSVKRVARRVSFSGFVAL